MPDGWIANEVDDGPKLPTRERGRERKGERRREGERERERERKRERKRERERERDRRQLFTLYSAVKVLSHSNQKIADRTLIWFGLDELLCLNQKPLSIRF